MKKYPLFVLAMLCTRFADAAETPVVSAAACWIRAVPDGGAAYFTLSNPSDKAVTLTEVEVEGYGMAMLHESKNVGGMMKMSDVDEVPVPAHGSVSFAPGAYHVMLMNEKKPPVIGKNLQLSLKFRDAPAVTAACVVKTPDAIEAK